MPSNHTGRHEWRRQIKQCLMALAGAWGVALGLPAQADSPASATLAGRWAAMCAGQPALPAGDAARMLNVSEAELVATGIGKTAVLLRHDDHAARGIMRRALDFGKVLAQTRNAHGLLERTGVAMRLEQDDDAPSPGPEHAAHHGNIAGGYLGGDIDLRFNFANWKHAFAVTEPGRDGRPARSLQFFDAHGNAVHTLYLKNEAAVNVFDKLAADFRAPDQQRPLAIVAAPAQPLEKPDSAIDVQQFRQAWAAMTDPHQLNLLVAEFGLTREQAMRLAPAGAVRRVPPQALRTLLDQVAKQQLAITALLGNAGVTQIVRRTIAATAADQGGGDGACYIVQEPDFSLRLRASALKSGYVVRRAGVASVEFHDKDGELVVMFFGVRERGKPQPRAWEELIARLPQA